MISEMKKKWKRIEEVEESENERTEKKPKRPREQEKRKTKIVVCRDMKKKNSLNTKRLLFF